MADSPERKKYDLVLLANSRTPKVYLIQRGYHLTVDEVCGFLTALDVRFPVGSAITTKDLGVKALHRHESDLLMLVPHPYNVPELAGT